MPLYNSANFSASGTDFSGIGAVVTHPQHTIRRSLAIADGSPGKRMMVYFLGQTRETGSGETYP